MKTKPFIFLSLIGWFCLPKSPAQPGIVDAAMVRPFVAAGAGPTGIAGWWKLNEGSLSTAADSSGNTNTGTLTGSPAWVTGESGSGFALQFDGTGGMNFSVTNSPSLQLTAAFTYTIWCRRAATARLDPLFAQFDSPTAGRQILIYFTTSPPDAVQVDIPFVKAIATSVSTVTNTSWHFVAVTRNGSVWKIYFDGNLDQTVADSTTQEIAGTLEIAHLTPTGNTSFSGSIDDPRIYNRELSSAEISTLFIAGAQ